MCQPRGFLPNDEHEIKHLERGGLSISTLFWYNTNPYTRFVGSAVLPFPSDSWPVRVRRSLWLFVLLFLPLAAQAQVLLRGVVRDVATGVTLAAAHVVVEGTDQGAITNREGQFEIVVPALPVVLRVRYIGYQTQRQVARS